MSCQPKNEKLKDIAVVNAKFDDIEKVLNKYRISYKKCNYADLEKKEFFYDYRTFFFPCGVENLIETNVNILSRGTRIHSVSLKKDFLEVNDELIYKNIKSFIEKGGNAYFSDYSYKLLDGAFKSMEFFDGFPNMGIGERINLELKNNLAFFCKERELKVEMPHPGWVVVKSINNSDTLAESTVNTIRGAKKCPIISTIKAGKGETIYTSYHGEHDDELSRYIVFRLAYKYLLDDLLEKMSHWEQDINCTIIDSIREWESFRSYLFPLKKGNNTIYFSAEKGPFQIDIFDKDKKIIVSKDSRDSKIELNIKSNSGQNILIKIFPANPKMLGVYSIISADGVRIIPYQKTILYFIIFIAIGLSLYWFNKTFGLKKFSGRIKQK